MRPRPEDCPVCQNGEGEIPTLVTLFGPEHWTCHYCKTTYIRRLEEEPDV